MHRSLFVQLTPPRSFLDIHTENKDLERKDQSAYFDARAELQQEKASFLKAAFLLFLNSHLVLWTQQTHELKADLAQQLRTLQVRETELSPHTAW